MSPRKNNEIVSAPVLAQKTRKTDVGKTSCLNTEGGHRTLNPQKEGYFAIDKETSVRTQTVGRTISPDPAKKRRQRERRPDPKKKLTQKETKGSSRIR